MVAISTNSIGIDGIDGRPLGSSTGPECQREAPARWPATLRCDGVPRVTTWPTPSGAGKSAALRGPVRGARPVNTASPSTVRDLAADLVGRPTVDLLRTD